MNITGIDKAELLAALYNRSKQQGDGFLQLSGRGGMTKEEAQVLLDESEDKYFDYVRGRVMKIDLSTDELRTDLYNRDVGTNAAESIVELLKNKAHA